MRRFFAAATIIGLSGAAFAASTFDANGDGAVTLEELRKVVPEVLAVEFDVYDLNSDGTLSAREIQAAQASGALPK